MNSNLFDRKTFIDGNLMAANITQLFTNKLISNNIIVKVNLLRATANESVILKKHLEQTAYAKNSKIIFDLNSCTFIDSTFLSCIISYNKKYNRDIRLVVSDKRQLAIFKITKLDSLFKIYTSLNNALES